MIVRPIIDRDLPASRTKSSDHYEFIDQAISSLIVVPYDHDGKGGLPLRADVFAYLAVDLFPSDLQGDIRAAGLPLPTVTLLHDGTVSLRYVVGLRSLTLTVPTDGVILSRQTFDDGQTRIEARIDHQFVAEEVAEMFDWLAGAEVQP